jgi:menaquinone reductase, multiheme cytochrome c subunit
MQAAKPPFPKWINKAIRLGLVGAALTAATAAGLGKYASMPDQLDVGYQPTQPVPYSHKLHAGELGMDCRFCHTTVDKADFAAVPPTETCMVCHSRVKTDSPKLVKVRESYETGKPIEWVKVHDLPDFAYFSHRAHVVNGISCVSCHGRVDQMDVVQQVKPLGMAMCIECHRNPENALRPREFVTKLDWTPPAGTTQAELGRKIAQELKIHPPVGNCAGCHR